MQDLPHACILKVGSQTGMEFGTNISLAENLPEHTGHESKNRLEGGFLGRIKLGSREIGSKVSAKSE